MLLRPSSFGASGYANRIIQNGFNSINKYKIFLDEVNKYNYIIWKTANTSCIKMIENLKQHGSL